MESPVPEWINAITIIYWSENEVHLFYEEISNIWDAAAYQQPTVIHFDQPIAILSTTFIIRIRIFIEIF